MCTRLRRVRVVTDASRRAVVRLRDRLRAPGPGSPHGGLQVKWERDARGMDVILD